MPKTKKFKVGDSVRLNKGWTEMIVIELRNDESIVAKYHSASEEDYAYPYKALSTKHRDADEFTAWDGKKKIDTHNTADRYLVVTTGDVGSFKGTTSSGLVILELEKGTIGTYTPESLVGITTQYFAARMLNHEQHLRYFKMTPNQELLGLGVGALMINNDGRMYQVKAIYTHFNPCGSEKIFEGSFFPSLDFA